MDVRVINTVDGEMFSQIAKLHYDSLSYRSFITLFGVDFLRKIYEAIVMERLGFFVVAVETNALKGFLLGLTDSTQLTKIIFKRILNFLPMLISGLIKHPGAIRYLWETVFYADKEGGEIKPELLVMAVQEEHRSQGIGSALVRKLDEEFRKKGIHHYKVTVHQEMKRSIHFYERNCMSFKKPFRLYGHVWNVYVRDFD